MLTVQFKFHQENIRRKEIPIVEAEIKAESEEKVRTALEISVVFRTQDVLAAAVIDVAVSS